MVINDDELIDVFDEQENIIGTMTRAEAIAKNHIRMIAFAFVFNEQGKLLVHRRSLSKSSFPGFWDLKVGGLVDHGEKPEQTVLREVKEEIGAAIHPKFLFKFRYKFKNKMNSLNYVYKAVCRGNILPEKEEIAEFEWVDVKDVGKLVNTRRFIPNAVFLYKNHWKQIVGENT